MWRWEHVHRYTLIDVRHITDAVRCLRVAAHVLNRLARSELAIAYLNYELRHFHNVFLIPATLYPRCWDSVHIYVCEHITTREQSPAFCFLGFTLLLWEVLYKLFEWRRFKVADIMLVKTTTADCNLQGEMSCPLTRIRIWTGYASHWESQWHTLPGINCSQHTLTFDRTEATPSTCAICWHFDDCGVSNVLSDTIQSFVTTLSYPRFWANPARSNDLWWPSRWGPRCFEHTTQRMFAHPDRTAQMRMSVNQNGCFPNQCSLLKVVYWENVCRYFYVM